ncbi:hypothetical protein [Rhizobium leguminosarum]|uniref:hypothetical protein n=1 Tax=Rhizobium leguminosarum TaxID=384 RepID=UPI0010314169|nr:hypothetical protein [Rhizobium leguminosarum]TAV89585.1 hypothetical protein ELI22_10365 [Rhizobium leguminosarum]TAV94195.1 hypothetical protein ELI21_10515 [Rhizobium leguminosarum]TAW35270.1 hypothetical protein ELI23_10555 [Rhizobium leguminosarum]
MTENLTVEQLYEQARFNSYAEYLAEAVSCFNSEAYRACIIMTSNAVFHSLRDYIQDLADRGFRDAGIVIAEMNQAIKAGKAFEGVLENSLKNLAAFLPDDQLALREIRDKRNTSAHPNGYTGNRDDAYSVLKKAVNHFLSTRPDLPKLAMAKLLEDLESQTFFSSDLADDASRTVADAMTTIHPSSYNWLVNELQARVSADPEENDSNAVIFLCGLVRLEMPALNERIHNVFFKKRKGFDPTEDAVLVELVASYSQFLSMTVGEDRHRLDAMFKRFCEKFDNLPDADLLRSPQWLMNALEKQFSLSDAAMAYPVTVATILGKFALHTDFHYLAATDLKEMYITALIRSLQPQSSGAENVLAALLKEHEKFFSRYLSQADLKRIFEALDQAKRAGSQEDSFPELRHLRPAREMVHIPSEAVS